MPPILLPRRDISVTTLCCPSQNLACSIGISILTSHSCSFVLSTLHRLLDPAVSSIFYTQFMYFQLVPITTVFV